MTQIEITHFLNPHQFWFRYSKCDGDKHVQRIEYELAQSIPVKMDANNTRVGDIVAMNWTARRKWIRACVDHVDDANGRLIVWAMDYGRPICTSFTLISSIETELKELCGQPVMGIHFGGIYGVRPKIAQKICVSIRVEYITFRLTEEFGWHFSLISCEFYIAITARKQSHRSMEPQFDPTIRKDPRKCYIPICQTIRVQWTHFRRFGSGKHQTARM